MKIKKMKYKFLGILVVGFLAYFFGISIVKGAGNCNPFYANFDGCNSSCRSCRNECAFCMAEPGQDCTDDCDCDDVCDCERFLNAFCSCIQGGGASSFGGESLCGNGNPSGNASGGNASGGNASGGNASGGNASGGNASGGNASGGNASGGNASGGNASGGNASGGNASGGNASGGNVSGGNSTCHHLLQSGGTCGFGYMTGTEANGSSCCILICGGSGYLPEGGTSSTECKACEEEGTKPNESHTRCICNPDLKCCGVQLNNVVPFIGDCIEMNAESTRDTTTSVTSVTAFPILMQGLMKILMSVIMIFSFLMIIVAGLLIVSGAFDGSLLTTGKKIIKNVIISLILLGCSGLILSLINPSFFGG